MPETQKHDACYSRCRSMPDIGFTDPMAQYCFLSVYFRKAFVNASISMDPSLVPAVRLDITDCLRVNPKFIIHIIQALFAKEC